MSEQLCNICGHPSVVKYQEWDADEGKMVETSHMVPCIGHAGVPDYLWNKSRSFDTFARFQAHHRVACAKPARIRVRGYLHV